MGLFKKKTPLERTLEFNRAKLTEEIQNLSSKLYLLRNELSIVIIKEVIEMARNIQLLEMNRVKSDEDLAIHRGRLQALSDLVSYIDRSMTNKPKDQEDSQPRDAVRMRRVSNQAGPAI